MTFEQIRDDVSALAVGWRDYRQDDRRFIDHPALIAQLRAEMHSAGSKSDGGGVKMRAVYGSKPPMAEEPWEVLADIENGVAGLLAELGGRARADVREGLLLLVTLANAGDLNMIAVAVRGWRRRAEVVLSYRRASRRLAAPCPACGQTHALLVAMDEYGPESARCAACEAAWEWDQIGLLATLIAGAAGGGDGVGQTAERMQTTRG